MEMRSSQVPWVVCFRERALEKVGITGGVTSLWWQIVVMSRPMKAEDFAGCMVPSYFETPPTRQGPDAIQPSLKNHAVEGLNSISKEYRTVARSS